jgi:hypothetical protein
MAFASMALAVLFVVGVGFGLAAGRIMSRTTTGPDGGGDVAQRFGLLGMGASPVESGESEVEDVLTQVRQRRKVIIARGKVEIGPHENAGIEAMLGVSDRVKPNLVLECPATGGQRVKVICQSREISLRQLANWRVPVGSTITVRAESYYADSEGVVLFDVEVLDPQYKLPEKAYDPDADTKEICSLPWKRKVTPADVEAWAQKLIEAQRKKVRLFIDVNGDAYLSDSERRDVDVKRRDLTRMVECDPNSSFNTGTFDRERAICFIAMKSEQFWDLENHPGARPRLPSRPRTEPMVPVWK